MMKESTWRQAGEIGDRFFLSPAFQALTIGIPFCIFKMFFGLLALRSGESSPLFVFAWLVLAWAVVDLIMNLVRFVCHLGGRPSPVEYCSIAQAGRLLKRPRLFLAIDTLISFSIISFILWSGWISLLSRPESYFWYAATTLNLISVSLVNIWIELRREEKD